MQGRSTRVPIADAPELLTAEWLTSALRISGGLAGRDVVDVDMRPVGTGQMCDCWRLSLTYDAPTPLPATLVAKLPAADPTSRATALALRSYESEVRFYQQLALELPVRTPGVYHADIDVETASFVLLLEDLAPAEQGDQLAGCSPAVARLALRELVKLHAPRWGDSDLSKLEWLHKDPKVGREFLLSALPGLWDGFRQRYGASVGEAEHAAGDALFSSLDSYLDPGASPLTVVHGDFRLDNLLFGTGGGSVPIAVLDWQTCGHGPGLYDVAYFIGAGLSADDRRAVERSLVQEYFEQLLEAGVTGYSWDSCWYDYRRGSWSGLVMAVAASMLVERTERGDRMFLAMAARHSQHAIDLKASELLVS